MRRTLAVLLIVGAVCIAHPVGFAKGGSTKQLDKAAALAAQGSVEAAATAYATIVAKAHKKGDLLLERDAARGLDALMSGGTASAGGTRRVTNAPLTELDRELLALVIGRLDPKRGGAFVTTTSLARELLQSATQQGDAEWVEDALRVLKVQEQARLFGRAPGTLARYANGLVAVRDEKPEVATSHLEAALETCVDESWAELASFVATELAATWVARGEPAKASDALQQAVELFEDGASPSAAAAFQAVAKRRLADAPDDVLKPLLALTSGVPAVDGLGSLPGSLADTGFGKAKKTPLGRAFKKIGRSKPLASVLCLPSRFRVSTFFEPKETSAHPHSGSTRRVGKSGLVVRLRGRTVGLDDVRLENEAASGLGRGIATVRVPGGLASAMRASYLLARDETWTLAKSGAVKIHR